MEKLDRISAIEKSRTLEEVLELSKDFRMTERLFDAIAYAAWEAMDSGLSFSECMVEYDEDYTPEDVWDAVQQDNYECVRAYSYDDEDEDL